MKKRTILYLIFAFILFIIIYSLISNYTYKHAYTTKPMTSFNIPELQNSDRWKTAIAASDSMIYAVECRQDTTGFTSKGVAYSFNGKKDNDFQLPPESFINEVFSDFGYLHDKNQLFLCNLYKNSVDFFNMQGNLIRREIVGKVILAQKLSNMFPIADLNKVNSVAEYKDDLYYTITQNGKNWGLYKELPGKRMKVIQTVKQNKKETLNDLYVLMVDSNGKNTMAVADVMHKEIRVSFFLNDKKKKFSISRHPDVGSPWYFYLWDWQKLSHIWKQVILNLPSPGQNHMPDAPFGMYAGANYIVLTTWGRTDHAPDTNTIYNLHGRNLGHLICKNDKDAKLVDISGDKLIFLNRTTGKVSIEQIKVK